MPNARSTTASSHYGRDSSARGRNEPYHQPPARSDYAGSDAGSFRYSKPIATPSKYSGSDAGSSKYPGPTAKPTKYAGSDAGSTRTAAPRVPSARSPSARIAYPESDDEGSTRSGSTITPSRHTRSHAGSSHYSASKAIVQAHRNDYDQDTSSVSSFSSTARSSRRPLVIDVNAAWERFSILDHNSKTSADLIPRLIQNQKMIKERVVAMELRLAHLEDIETRMVEMEARLDNMASQLSRTLGHVGDGDSIEQYGEPAVSHIGSRRR